MEAQGLATARYRVIPRTLVFVRHKGSLLLMRRGTDREVWPGRFNGVGGHVESGEGLAESARREVFEETGLHVDDLHLVGLLHVTDEAQSEGVLVAVFAAEASSDAVTASGEGELRWIRSEAALELDLVPDLAEILPRLLGSGPDRVFLARSTGKPGQPLTFVE